MNKQRYLLFFLIAYSLLWCAESIAAPVEVRGARFWATPDKARLVFDLASPVRFDWEQHDGEVVVTLKNALLLSNMPELAGSNRYLKAIRRLPTNGEDVSLALDTNMPLQVSGFLLRPMGPYGNRLVIDLSAPESASAATGTTPADDGKALWQDSVQSGPRSLSAAGSGRSWLVAIDAGHGGEDPGAIGPDGDYEKNVTLAIARALAHKINQTPGMRAFLTRDGDYFVTLWDRTKRARRMKADIFVSIHADASPGTAARGASVYTLSAKGATDQAAAMLANKENQADLVGGIRIADKDSMLASVLLDLSQTATISDSQVLATDVLANLRRVTPLHRSNFGQAGFVVLKSPDVPSILVETGYITNPEEERLLTNPDYQDKLADAIYHGIGQYMTRNKRALPIPASTLVSRESMPALRTEHVEQPKLEKNHRHRVRSGETLTEIARAYDVSLDRLQELNSLKSGRIMAGQQLVLP